MPPSLKDLVDSWLQTDQNEETREEIRRLWEQGNTVELERRLRTRIEFGTAGLRGRMEAGFSRMNDLIIIQTSQGLCNYISTQVHNTRSRGIVIGHDHRHNSERWAGLTAAVFIQEGFTVYLHRGLVHTPLSVSTSIFISALTRVRVPFTVRHKEAAAGVMITASHNPKQDNGYKVYWGNAVQIIAPHDVGISNAIASKLNVELSLPWSDAAIQAYEHPQALDVTNEMYELYFQVLKTLAAPVPSESTINFVTTPMHGVGNKPVLRALQDMGLPLQRILVVPEQQEPNPEFPTVSFPNPEEHGALVRVSLDAAILSDLKYYQTLAMRKADEIGAAYVLAQDPDADRFSAAERTSAGWHQFSGDQLGSLFASRALNKYKETGKSMDRLAMVASTVSSKMIESMAKVEGFRFVECLTGFKYIGNVACRLVEDGYDVPFGYEEAIGFMLENGIRDKDGVSATVAFVELVTQLETRGLSALQYIEELYGRYGYFETNNSYFICRDPPTINAIFARLRDYNSVHPGSSNTSLRSPAGATYPTKIASLGMYSVRDLTSGYGFDSTRSPHFQPDLPLSGGHMITFRAGSLEQDNVEVVLTIRTSGTEPKIKYYLEGKGSDRTFIAEILRKVVAEIRDDWMEATKNNLEEP
ncbi:Phosphoglucomutase-3 [Serendipita sp. 399]|nr:Phosphoglucomutase-3 [Serendipita sp. 399]